MVVNAIGTILLVLSRVRHHSATDPCSLGTVSVDVHSMEGILGMVDLSTQAQCMSDVEHTRSPIVAGPGSRSRKQVDRWERTEEQDPVPVHGADRFLIQVPTAAPLLWGWHARQERRIGPSCSHSRQSQSQPPYARAYARGMSTSHPVVFYGMASHFRPF